MLVISHLPVWGIYGLWHKSISQSTVVNALKSLEVGDQC